MSGLWSTLKKKIQKVQSLLLEGEAEQIIIRNYPAKFELASLLVLGSYPIVKNGQNLEGFRGSVFFFLNAEQIIMTNHHTKFELASSKRLEVIPS